MKSILNESQIEKIADTVHNSNIASAEMKDDLIDHLCCMVEDEMSKGGDFETAYQVVLQRFYPKGLNEVPDETVFLFTSKSRKKIDRVISISGFAILTGILITVVMKMLHLPFAQMVLLATFFVFLLILFPAIFIRKMKGKKRIPVFGIKGILFYVGAILFIIAIVFHISHYPGGIYILWLASIIIYVAVFPLFFFKTFKKSR